MLNEMFLDAAHPFMDRPLSAMCRDVLGNVADTKHRGYKFWKFKQERIFLIVGFLNFTRDAKQFQQFTLAFLAAILPFVFSSLTNQ